jgi:gliding motility-associated-like protein
MVLKKNPIFVILVLLVSGNLYAQSPCTILGQNPETAFPVCGTSVFQQDTVPYCGRRLIPSPCYDPDSIITDKNPFWYKFTCFSSGKLAFLITPNSIDEDYDWQLFDVTGKNPQDVYTDPGMFVVCNWSGEKGLTGASDVLGGTSLFECQGLGVNRFSKMPDLITGHNYLLLISHWDDTQLGYGLSFGGVGNTAVITDTLPPHMFTAGRANCDGTKLLVKLNKKMKCSSLAGDGSDFQISPAAAAITNAVGIGCSGAFDMDSVLLTFNAPLPIGNYNLIAQNGTDANTLLDLCDNGIPAGESIPFTVLSPLPVPMDSLTNNKCNSDSLVLVFPELIKCNSVAPDGSDFFITGIYPVTITNAIPVNCITGLTTRIIVHFNTTLFVPGNFQIVLRLGTDGNTILSECDTPSVAGSAIPFSILPKPVADFKFPGTVCLPDGNVTFTNLSSIADGSENAFRYVWNFGDSLSGGNNLSILKTPSHFYNDTGPFNVNLKVTSNGGCIKDTTILLNTIHPQPITNFGISKPDICLGDAVFLTDSTNSRDGVTVEWNWNLGDGRIKNTQNVLYIYSNDETYNVSLYTVNSHGCKSDLFTKPVTVHPYPSVNAGPDRTVLEGGTITIQASATGTNLQYLWTPAQYLNDPTGIKPKCIEPKFDILYTLRVTAPGGCTTTDQVFVDVLKIPVIPNTFSPNYDGINDFWYIQYLDEYVNNHTQVFTRAGQLVFESRGYYKAWNGTYKGKSLPMDTYYYIIEPGSGREPFTGYVTIIR